MALSLDTTIGAGGIIVVEAEAFTATTASFSTAAGVRLVALGSSNGNTTTTITISTPGGGITWAREVQAVVREGGAEIWLAYSASALSAQTVKIDQIPGGTGGEEGVSLTVVAILGAEATHGGGEATGSSASGTPDVAITTLRNDSYILSSMSDWSAAGDPGVGASPAETKLNGHTIAAKYSGGQSRTTSTQSIGTYNMDYTGSATRNYNMAVVEIREDTAGGAPAVVAGAAPQIATPANEAAISRDLTEMIGMGGRYRA